MTVIIKEISEKTDKYIELFDTVKEFKKYLVEYLKQAQLDLINDDALPDGVLIEPYAMLEDAPFSEQLRTFEEISGYKIEIK